MSIRPVREITAEEENFRMEPVEGAAFSLIRRDPVEPEPVGTIVVMAFRVTGYSKDCDGSLMAELDNIDKDGESTGWTPGKIGLYPDVDLVVTDEEWTGMFTTDKKSKVNVV